MSVQAYLAPKTIDECLDCLSQYQGEASLIAGGTDLMPKLENGKISPKALVDTTRINGFESIQITEDSILIGASVTHAKVSQHKELTTLIPALSSACGSVGSPQIRNIGTLSGNVVNAQPAADGAIALVALGAQAEISSINGLERKPVEDLYLGLGQSVVDPSKDILATFVLNKPLPGQACAFGRIAPRNTLCLPTVNVAVWLSSESDKITSARIAMGPVSDRPFRAKEAEESLVGVGLDDQKAFQKAAIIASKTASPRDSCFRGCSDYRRQLIKILCGRVVEQAAQRAIKTSVK